MPFIKQKLLKPVVLLDFCKLISVRNCPNASKMVSKILNSPKNYWKNTITTYGINTTKNTQSSNNTINTQKGKYYY